MIARNSIASVTFRDSEAATNILTALSARPSIFEAALILDDGSLFAQFRRDSTNASPVFAGENVSDEGEIFTDSHLAVSRTVGRRDQNLGRLIVVSDLREIDLVIRRYTVLAIGITVGVVLFSLLLSRVLQHRIATPIEALETLSNRISSERNYALRAVRTSDDELGRLADAFNSMLEEIQARDSELRVAKESAEEASRQVSHHYSAAQEANRDLEKENRDRRRAEAELLQKTDALKRSNIELQEFAYVASHDLQEPLRMVIMFTQLLKKRYGESLDEKAMSYIDYAVDGAGRMQLLIRDLLEYSRVGQMEIGVDPIDFDTLLEGVLSDLQLSINESRAKIQVMSLPILPGNPARLRQLFQNLISNAMKFRDDRPSVIQIGAREEGEFWRFSVADNGVGFDVSLADRVFMLFQRLHTREEYEGTGIGLALCKKIVNSHGGEIWVESQVGEGTTFFFTLPSTQETTIEKPAEESSF